MIEGIVRWAGWPAAGTGLSGTVEAGGGPGRATVAVPGGGDGWLASGEPGGTARVGSVAVAADLALTNLEALGSESPGETDPGPLIARLYRRDGPAFVRRLEGGFALAVCDERTGTLLLAVDRFGIKRLHYLERPGVTVFGARAGRVPGLAGQPAAADPTAVLTYLHFGYVPAPASIFSGVRRLPPGTTLTVRDGRTVEDRYWDMAYPVRRRTMPEAAGAALAATEGAVAAALRGVPAKETGAFLSGGTDSSAVVGLMGRVTGESANAFSIGFAEERYDELAYATLTARHFGAAHYTGRVSPEDALAWLPRLVDAYDEPFGNNSAFGTLGAAVLAHECGIRRLLAGDGGDEIFGGNERYRTDRVLAAYHRIPGFVRGGVLEPILLGGLGRRVALLGKARRYIWRARLPNPGRFYHTEFFFAGEGADLLDAGFRSVADAQAPHAVLQGHYERAAARDELNRLMYLDLKLTIGDNDLLKVTRTAELAGVEVRFPMLHRPLVELSGTWPVRFKVRGLEKRVLFKRAFAGLLPAETLAKRKHGFGVPTSTWLKRHPGFRTLSRDILLSSRARQRGYFRPGAIEELFARLDADPTPYYGDVLWTILMLELWHRRHLEGASVP